MQHLVLQSILEQLHAEQHSVGFEVFSIALVIFSQILIPTGMMLFHLRGTSLQQLFWQRQLLQESLVSMHIGSASLRGQSYKLFLGLGEAVFSFFWTVKSDNYNPFLDVF